MRVQINYERIGRINFALDPEKALVLQKKYSPILKDFKHISEIYALICSKYPAYEQFDRHVLTAACIYQLYCPASLIGSRCQNAPAGMRKSVADLLGYPNGTNINYWQDIARTFVKGRRYGEKIASITRHFVDLAA